MTFLQLEVLDQITNEVLDQLKFGRTRWIRYAEFALVNLVFLLLFLISTTERIR